MEATTPNLGPTGATSSGQLRTSQLDGPSGTVPRLANVEGPRILYASLGSLRVLKDLLEAIHTKDVRDGPDSSLNAPRTIELTPRWSRHWFGIVPPLSASR